eukprot:9496283-Pyramimonas_sp.AAC.1
MRSAVGGAICQMELRMSHRMRSTSAGCSCPVPPGARAPITEWFSTKPPDPSCSAPQGGAFHSRPVLPG